jgi:hypothetical protein
VFLLPQGEVEQAPDFSLATVIDQLVPALCVVVDLAMGDEAEGAIFVSHR